MNAPGGTARPVGSPQVNLQFDRADRHYEPRAEVLARYACVGFDADAVQAVERSMVWYTEGKGEEDLGVHWFDRLEGEEQLGQALPNGAFAVRLPASPLSYEGVIVKVRWCVRVRVFFVGGRDFVSEHVFDVGDIPPARGPLEPLA